MTDKRFDYVMNEFDEIEYITDIVDCEDRDFADFLDYANKMAKENEQLKEQREKLFFRERDTKNRWRELKQENEELKKQMQRLYNYFVDWHGDIMGANQFSEMWDDVKEDEDWEY